MKNFGTILIWSTWLLFSTCTIHGEVERQSDLKVNSDFSDNEIEIIQEFIHYMNSNVSVFTLNSSSICVYSMDSSVYQDSDLDQVIDELLKSNNLEHIGIALAKQESDNLFDDFWKVHEVHYPFTETTELELKINSEGRYFKLLEQLADKEKLVNRYYNLLIPFGEVSPGMVALLIKTDGRNMDFQSESIQLMWIVHYITLITQIEGSIAKGLETKKMK